MNPVGLALVIVCYLGIAAGAAQGMWAFAGYNLSWSIFGLVAVWSVKPAQYLATTLGVAIAIDLLAQDDGFLTLKLSLLVASLALLLASRGRQSQLVKYGLIVSGIAILSAQLFLDSPLPSSDKLKIAGLNFAILSLFWLVVYQLIFKTSPRRRHETKTRKSEIFQWPPKNHN